MNEKENYLLSEGDTYFQRNVDKLSFDKYRSNGTRYLDAFLSRLGKRVGQMESILEIGCSSGYNLAYLCKKYGLSGAGIEPSKYSVQVGNEWAKAHSEIKLQLVRGTADDLPFEDATFDIVMLGFCLYCTDRAYLHRSIAEADRVLKGGSSGWGGGYLLIEDFQTPMPFRRPNKHNSELSTYKYDYAKMFLSDPCYTLIERTTYSHSGIAFDPEIQERVSTSILYEEAQNNVYLFHD